MTLHDAPAGSAPGGVNGNGSSAPSEPLRPPSSKGVSMKLAMIVPGLGLAILIIFIVAEALSPPTGQEAIVKPAAVVAGGLHSTAGASLLQSITAGGEPPGNILSHVVVPAGSTVVSHLNNSFSAGSYDAQVEMKVAATQGALTTFFNAALRKEGWQVNSQGPASHDPGGLQVLGNQAGLDGYRWVIGATVQPTVFPSGGPPAGVTYFTIRLFQSSDIQ